MRMRSAVRFRPRWCSCGRGLSRSRSICVKTSGRTFFRLLVVTVLAVLPAAAWAQVVSPVSQPPPPTTLPTVEVIGTSPLLASRGEVPITSTVGSVVGGGGWLTGDTTCAHAAAGSTARTVTTSRRKNVRPDVLTQIERLRLRPRPHEHQRGLKRTADLIRIAVWNYLVVGASASVGGPD